MSSDDPNLCTWTGEKGSVYMRAGATTRVVQSQWRACPLTCVLLENPFCRAGCNPGLPDGTIAGVGPALGSENLQAAQQPKVSVLDTVPA